MTKTKTKHPSPRSIEQARRLAQSGAITQARAVVAENPGPLAVIEVTRPSAIHPRIVPRRIKHQTLPTLIEYFTAPFRGCPMCGATAITRMPPVLASQQTDGTTAVCHPGFGGCNTGFEVTP